MDLSTTRWNSADYLRTDEDIRLYLEACLEEAEDDPAFIVQALGVAARACNMSQLAKDTGLTCEGLDSVLSSKGNPSFSAVARVARALGFRLTLHPIA